MVGFWKYLIPKDVNAMLKSILVTTANGKPQSASTEPFAVCRKRDAKGLY